jgi:glycosyltransferase involved in cell wall biosynthesis
MIKFSDKVVTVDPRIGQRIRRYGAKEFSYLRNMPEEDMFALVPFELDPDFIDFAYVGTFATARRTKELLIAWHGFKRGRPKCRLWLVGWDCSGDGYFEREMAPYIDNKTVFYLGPVPFDYIPKIYRRMDFIVIPNMGDHWQLKLGESLAAKVPVILRDGPLHQMLVGSIGGVYFKSDGQMYEPLVIKDALITAFENREVLKDEAMSREPPYWESDVKKLVEVYKQIGEN